MQEALEAKEKEAKENYDLYLRAVAELDNFEARDKADIIKFGKEDLIKNILPFLDSLDHALLSTGTAAMHRLLKTGSP